jgi:hypothetical protein
MDGTVYLLHFLEPIGNPANPHVRHVQAKGIGFVVAATWPGGLALERQLKRRKHASRFCPICCKAKGR